MLLWGHFSTCHMPKAYTVQCFVPVHLIFCNLIYLVFWFEMRNTFRNLKLLWAVLVAAYIHFRQGGALTAQSKCGAFRITAQHIKISAHCYCAVYDDQIFQHNVRLIHWWLHMVHIKIQSGSRSSFTHEYDWYVDFHRCYPRASAEVPFHLVRQGSSTEASPFTTIRINHKMRRLSDKRDRPVGIGRVLFCGGRLRRFDSSGCSSVLCLGHYYHIKPL